MANNNGNITLFLISLFSLAAPSYKIRAGKNPATTFYFSYLMVIYAMIYFTQQ